MLQLNPRRLLVGLYLATEDLVDRFLESAKPTRAKIAAGTDLCTMVKSIGLAALILLLYAALAALAVWCVILLPYRWYGLAPVYGTLVVAAAAGVCWLIVRSWKWAEPRLEDYRNERADRRHQEAMRRKAEAGEQPPPEPSFWDIVGEYMAGVKNQYCPRVSWSMPIRENPGVMRYAPSLPQVITGLCIAVASAIGIIIVGYSSQTAYANFSVAAKTTCRPNGAYSSSGPTVTVNLICDGGVVAAVWDTRTVAYAFNHPGQPLDCVVYKDDQAFCSLP